MSTFLSQARARALRPVAALPRPRLTVVPRAASRAPRVPFVVLVVTLLAVGLVGLLLLNTSLERGAYTAGALRDAGGGAEPAAAGAAAAGGGAAGAAAGGAARPSGSAWCSNDSPAFLVARRRGKVIGMPIAGMAGEPGRHRARPVGASASRTPRSSTRSPGPATA